jgi:hypothetical protein
MAAGIVGLSLLYCSMGDTKRKRKSKRRTISSRVF